MIDGVGNVASILVLNGASPIGVAIVDRLVGPRLDRVILAGPPSGDLEWAAQRVRSFGVVRVETPVFEPTETWSHARLIDTIFNAGDVDVVVLASNAEADQRECEENPSEAVYVAATNYTGSVSVALNVTRRLRAQGHGTLVVLSSVAGERPRRSNFVYGSSMAGLDAFAVGLGDSMRGSGARVIVTRISPATGDPPAIASGVAAAIRSRRADVIYVPASLRTVMSGLRHLPGPVFRRLPQP